MTNHQKKWLKINLVFVLCLLAGFIAIAMNSIPDDTREEDREFQRELDARLDFHKDHADLNENLQGE